MTTFLQTLIDALAVGSFYALIALGYTMVYGILKFINFAHANVFMIGAWVSWIVVRKLGWAGGEAPLWAIPTVMVASMLFCGVLGVLIERLAYKPLRRADRLNILITAIGVSLLLENAAQLPFLFGTQPQRMPALISEEALATVAGVRIQAVDVTGLVVTMVLMLGLEWLVFRTKLGSAMRAVSWNPQTASLMGISPDRIVGITFFVGSALAAAAGFLYATKYPTLQAPGNASWVLLGLKCFVAAVVGGIGSIHGAVLGGFIIAFVELFGAAYLSPHLKDVYVFTILIGVLLVRPSGILGSNAREKV